MSVGLVTSIARAAKGWGEGGGVTVTRRGEEDEKEVCGSCALMASGAGLQLPLGASKLKSFGKGYNP